MFDAHVPDAVPRPRAARRRGSRRVAAVVLRRPPRPEPRAERGRGQDARDVQRRPDCATRTCGRVATTCTSACATCRRGGQLAGLNFPNWTGFSGQVLNAGPDRDVNLVMIKAYNDWHVDEWCGALSRPLHPVRDPAALRRGRSRRRGAAARRQGLPRGHVLGEPRRPRHAEHPLRRMGSAVRRVLRRRARCCAATSGRRRSRRRPSPDAPAPVPMSLSSVMAIYTLGDLLWADFWHRFPTCASRSPRATSGGSRTSCSGPSTRSTGTTDGCGTTPQGCSPTRALPTSASSAASSRTASACKLLDHFNVDNVCWESDYPHSDSSWPERARAPRRVVRGARPRPIDKITHGNAMRHFQFDPFATASRRPLHAGALRAESPDVDTVTRVGRPADERDLETWRRLTSRR